ncbi:GNAT family N-acetyltransferase [Vagococcus coleopterorum]|uniref:GNAT family N-acetyltransferase n=1 Tax=Vagococcus coleopterorum TaxID=2714946 RepID=A0A6G8ALS4_9ENTE|nr:GNAT family protein [Vagococcus coleopterorum]QIL46034.1 GNAT family N-acetyltransferase [Vagococcus coleopterorum]
MEEIEIIVKEAVPEDALFVQRAMADLSEETDFLTITQADITLPESIMANQLEQLYQSENNLLLLALAGDKIIGIASVKSDSHPSVSHVGEVGICIYKEFWGIGLGNMLLEEVKSWAIESEIVRRLELQVQVRNKRACQLYQKVGFEIEGESQRAAISSEGEWQSVYTMGLLID